MKHYPIINKFSGISLFIKNWVKLVFFEQNYKQNI